MMSTEDRIICDQVVFTSIRTPTGQGYRIVAASPGVRANEKAEITTRAPSHGSLCERGPDSVGLLSYRLADGRRCIGYVCHAGTEPTGRGGQRVYTHMVLLDPAAFRSFHSDPVMVHASIGEWVNQLGPMLKPPPHVEPLALAIKAPVPTASPTAADWIGPVAASLIAGRHMVLTGEQEPLALLELTLLSLPRHLRETIDATVEVRFSPARGAQLVMFRTLEPQLRRQLAGQVIQLCAVNTPAPAVPADLEAWFRLLARWRQENRFAEMVELTSHTCADAPVDSLARIAALCEDMDSVGRADIHRVETISGRYVARGGQTPAEQALLRQLQDKVRMRRSQLQEPANA